MVASWLRRRDALLITALVAACIPDRERAAGAPPAAGVRHGMLIGADSLAVRLQQPDAPVVLHVARARAEFDSAHIPGARFLDLADIVSEVHGLPNELPPRGSLDSVLGAVGVSNDASVVVYGEPLAAARAYFTLDVLGHRGSVALLDGGIAAWRAGAHAVSGAGEHAGHEPSGAPTSFSSSLAEARLADAEWIEARRGGAALALLDARPPEEFSGEKPGEGVTRPGHIPGARSLFWKRLIRSDTLPMLLDTAALRGLFAAAGAEPGDTVVTYCRTGMQASYAYFVARYMGYEAKMYDGSFLDWERVPTRAVEAGPDTGRSAER
jgi:thiosulfate/3-mercaptopyruvate sulfurtransferase